MLSSLDGVLSSSGPGDGSTSAERMRESGVKEGEKENLVRVVDLAHHLTRPV